MTNIDNTSVEERTKRKTKKEKNTEKCERGQTEENKRITQDEVLDEEEDEEKEEEDEYVDHYQKRNVKDQ